MSGKHAWLQVGHRVKGKRMTVQLQISLNKEGRRQIGRKEGTKGGNRGRDGKENRKDINAFQFAKSTLMSVLSLDLIICNNIQLGHKIKFSYYLFEAMLYSK